MEEVLRRLLNTYYNLGFSLCNIPIIIIIIKNIIIIIPIIIVVIIIVIMLVFHSHILALIHTDALLQPHKLILH